MGGKKHLDLLKKFKENLGKKIFVNKLILFGSRAWGKPQRYSDFDLIVVSKSFRNKDFFERGSQLFNYWNLNYPVDFICYTPEEFNKLKKGVTIVSKAIREGIEI
jgi:hypothetical protein